MCLVTNGQGTKVDQMLLVMALDQQVLGRYDWKVMAINTTHNHLPTSMSHTHAEKYSTSSQRAM